MRYKGEGDKRNNPRPKRGEGVSVTVIRLGNDLASTGIQARKGADGNVGSSPTRPIGVFEMIPSRGGLEMVINEEPIAAPGSESDGEAYVTTGSFNPVGEVRFGRWRHRETESERTTPEATDEREKRVSLFVEQIKQSLRNSGKGICPQLIGEIPGIFPVVFLPDSRENGDGVLFQLWKDGDYYHYHIAEGGVICATLDSLPSHHWYIVREILKAAGVEM